MGHRTLVAYDRDGYDLHYAHWGLAGGTITRATPFGGPPDTDFARTAAATLVEPAGGRATVDHETAVDPTPVATGLTFEEVVGHVDPIEHEALFVVDPAYEVRRYLVVALEGDAGRDRTALVRYDDGADARYLRGWLAGARAVRDVAGETPGPPAVAAALRVLDPRRGTVVFPAGPRAASDA